jgi:hypothetical protein
VVFTVLFDTCVIALLSPSSRFAERYVFSPVFFSAAIGLAAACQVWPRLPLSLGWFDRRVPVLPVLVWLTLIVLRLGFGPLLPRPRF